MQPTYTFSEIQTLIPTLDVDGIDALRELIQEEKSMYSHTELLVIYQRIMEHVLAMWKSETDLPGDAPQG
jgi:hypothetical protein